MAKLKKENFIVCGRIWVETDKGPFLGNGRIELLEKVKEFGSITKAAKSMEMSYRQAWELIDSMNKKSAVPFVIKQSGGKGGGGAEVTEVGIKAIEQFNNLNKAFSEFLKSQSENYWY